MVWLSRKYPSLSAWSEVFDLFQKRFMAMNAPHGMLMIEQHEPSLGSTIWIRLPDMRDAGLYPGFEPARTADRPKSATLLIGDSDEFEKLFARGFSDERGGLITGS